MYTLSRKAIGGMIGIFVVLCIACVFWYTRSMTTDTFNASVKTTMGGNDMSARYEEAGDMALIGEGAEDMVAERPAMSPSPDMDGSVVAPDVTERRIIRNGSLSLIVDDVRTAVSAVHTLAETTGGFVVSSNIYEYEVEAPSAHVSIRIPATGFDDGISQLRELGDVEHESITGRDVTEEYVDLEAQIGNLEATEAQFLSIMTRATEISDILAVQRELSNVRRQIEQIEGRMQYLEESAAYSLVTVSLATDPKGLPLVEEGQWRPLAEFKQAIRSLVVFGQGIVSAVIWVLIYAPVWIVLFFVGRFVYRKYFRS